MYNYCIKRFFLLLLYIFYVFSPYLRPSWNCLSWNELLTAGTSISLVVNEARISGFQYTRCGGDNLSVELDGADPETVVDLVDALVKVDDVDNELVVLLDVDMESLLVVIDWLDGLAVVNIVFSDEFDNSLMAVTVAAAVTSDVVWL